MGEAARRRQAQQAEQAMKAESASLIAQQIWEKADKPKVDEVLLGLTAQKLPRADLLIIGAGLIAVAWGDVLDQEPELFLCGLAHLILGLRKGQLAAAQAAAAAAGGQGGQVEPGAAPGEPVEGQTELLAPGDVAVADAEVVA